MNDKLLRILFLVAAFVSPFPLYADWAPAGRAINETLGFFFLCAILLLTQGIIFYRDWRKKKEGKLGTFWDKIFEKVSSWRGGKYISTVLAVMTLAPYITFGCLVVGNFMAGFLHLMGMTFALIIILNGKKSQKILYHPQWIRLFLHQLLGYCIYLSLVTLCCLLIMRVYNDNFDFYTGLLYSMRMPQIITIDKMLMTWGGEVFILIIVAILMYANILLKNIMKMSARIFSTGQKR